ncbi:DUF4920 domain-containing protein [uncultured Muriicola sp.]|uniref:DUF4920 domain-containing protein n=1 Tax=uncultured Muriicola sp. TaxID=1583102 RepID=UPI002612144C|nr:DUF4920 domain-containing protein [uncultured Muriicola sp.]
MKGFNIIIVIFLLFGSCKEQNAQSKTEEKVASIKEMQVFGESFNSDNAMKEAEISRAFEDLGETDTLTTAFYGVVTDVCKAKGCWMKVSLGDGRETMVTFKDYGFFVPKDIVGKEVVLSGKGFIEKMSVKDQQHFAKDGGASEAEISKITAAKVTRSFIADGVILEQ